MLTFDMFLSAQKILKAQIKKDARSLYWHKTRYINKPIEERFSICQT